MENAKIIKVIDFEGNHRDFTGTKNQFLKEQQAFFPFYELEVAVDPDTKVVEVYDAEEMRIMVEQAKMEFA